MADASRLRWKRDREHDEREDAEREVDVEDPAPGELRREVAAEQRAGDAGDAEDGAEDPLVAPAVARRDDVADDGLRGDHEPATAEALHGTEDDELQHRAAHAAEDGPDEEDADGDLQHDAAPVEVAELAVERGDDGLREEVGGDDPPEAIEAAELPDDG